MERLFEDPTLLIVVAVGAAIGWFLSRPRYRFLVQVDAGAARCTKGAVPGAFLDEVADAFRRHGLSSGWIGGLSRGRRVSLAFSANVPKECRQQLRNVWQFTR